MTGARISWEFPAGESHTLELANDITIIGRGRDCEIALLDERISRQHSEIYFDGEAHLVSDLGSFNGTYLNGEMLGDARPLEDGDQLQIGPVRLLFELAAASEVDPRSTLVVPESNLKAYLEIPDGLRIELDKAKTVIGRNQGWDVCLPDRAVSRPHAEIERRGDEFVLRDLGSANGTLLNATRLEAPSTLKDGDELVFGAETIIFRLEPA
jgi:pSer/pThr/pTyr-binding forkhead associated (FHA) protein